MASIPTNAFSAPRVRWVMQQKMKDEQQKKREVEMAGGGGATERRRLNSVGESSNLPRISEGEAIGHRRSTDAIMAADRDTNIAESMVRPILQRMQSATIMESFRNYLPVTITRPDFARSISCTDSIRDMKMENAGAQSNSTMGGGERTKTRYLSANQ